MFCEEHRPEVEHCHCTRQSQSQGQPLVMCDYCNRWQHTKCEGLKSSEAKLLEEYKCQICKQFESKVSTVLQPTIEGTSRECLY